MSPRSSREQFWERVFLAAITGTCADSEIGKAATVVKFAELVADEACERVFGSTANHSASSEDGT